MREKREEKYTMEYCEFLLRQNPQACSRLYSMVRRDALVAESKSVPARDLVRAALLDGPKTVGEILAWSRSLGHEVLDMPLCNLILPQLKKLDEVEWDGRLWNAKSGIQVPAPEPDVPEPPSPPDPEPPPHPEPTEPHRPGHRDWGQEIARVEMLKPGESATFPLPADMTGLRYVNNLRSLLSFRKETRDRKWSVVRERSNVKVVAMANLGAPSPPAASAPAAEPTIENSEPRLNRPPATVAVVEMREPAQIDAALRKTVETKQTLRFPEHARAVIDDLDRRIRELQALKTQLHKMYSENVCQSF